MEINQELQLQLEKYKPDFRDLTEKFLVSQATAYSLANHLQKYKCEGCKDIVESVLGEKLPVEVRSPAEKLAEKPTLDERLRTCDVLIRSQARELTQLRQTLQDRKDDSVLLKQHLKDLLTHNDLNNYQGQGFRESLSEGYRLAERLACKLSPEKTNDHDDLKGPEVVAPRFSRQMPQMVEDGVPQNSLDDYYLTYSVLPNLSDSFWPYRSTAVFSPEDLDASYARDVTSHLLSRWVQVDLEFGCAEAIENCGALSQRH
ncbi:neuroblastoma breakpoint family member 6-like [Cervus elaphus]|uniref:neuroblastoma breakpoint family member 6-like n=1 Tax=Cervus elaphus TaxID=9860 RepID=UPI001CC2F0E9|nr:neuroblastoma breakpoint family member 6-like [Cervus elaphus]